jgi:exodeoxyribonuclease VII small subunit
MADQDRPTDSGAPPPDIAGMSFEQALQELEQLVRRLEAGEVTLDESIQAYERGSQLKAHCERKLSEAQQKVETIARTAEGGVATRPFEGNGG